MRSHVHARTYLPIWAVAAALLLCQSAEGQLRVGGQVSWGDDADFAVGARVDVSATSIHPNVRFIGAFDYFFPDDGGSGDIDLSYWELTGAVVRDFTFSGETSARPYVGAGLNIARVSLSGFGDSVSDSETGLALLAGSHFGRGRITPFAEMRIALSGAEQFVVSGGILF